MTFDLAQMIADREAGTPGDKWVTMNWQTAKDDQVRADMRRENNVPLFEAEIIRLTARVAELEGDAAEFRSAAMWTKHAAEALDGYEADYGEPLPLIHEIGRIPDSRKTASFRIYPNHIRGLADLLKPRAALSTHTEEPKT